MCIRDREYLVKNHDKMEAKVYTAPPEIDITIAEHKLQAMGVKIDRLSDEQKSYITGWEEGT